MTTKCLFKILNKIYLFPHRSQKRKKIGKLFKTLYQRYIRINNSCQLKKNEKIVSYMKNKKRAQGASYLLDHGGYLLIYGSCQCYVCYFPQPRKPCGVQRLIEDWLLILYIHTWYLSPAPPAVLVEKNLSCGEVSPHDKCSVGDMSPHG